MDVTCPKYVPFVLIWALAAAAGCGERGASSPAGPAAVVPVFLTAEPLQIAPEFRASPSCQSPAFAARLTLRLRARQGLSLRGFRFQFRDRSGAVALPLAISTLGASSSLPGSSPVPLPAPSVLPAASPVPVPGFSSFDGMTIAAGASTTFPFLLEFGCGVPAAGTLAVRADTIDGRGASGTARVDVRVGG
jgi:hypothetical protein